MMNDRRSRSTRITRGHFPFSTGRVPPSRSENPRSNVQQGGAGYYNESSRKLKEGPLCILWRIHT